jgi:hypothetical protein
MGWPSPPVNVCSCDDLLRRLASRYKCSICGELVLRLGTLDAHDEIHINAHLDMHFGRVHQPAVVVATAPARDVESQPHGLAVLEDCDETCPVCGDMLRRDNCMIYDHDLDEWIYLNTIETYGHRVHTDCAEYLVSGTDEK